MGRDNIAPLKSESRSAQKVKEEEQGKLRGELTRLQQAKETLDTLDEAIRLADKITDPLLSRCSEGRMGSVQRLLRIMSRNPQAIADTTLGKIWFWEDKELLTDTLLLVHHLAYFALLPTIPKGTDKYNWLLSSFERFAHRLPRERDRHRILGLYWDEKGERDKAEECYEKALESTAPDSPEYMNDLQGYWESLVGRGKVQKAWRVLGEALEKVRGEDLPEVKEMIAHTVGYIREAQASLGGRSLAGAIK